MTETNFPAAAGSAGGRAKKVALAIAAHPDDIEFMMGGTLLTLASLGWETHYVTVGNGSVGSRTLPKEQIIDVRRGEAQAGAKALNAEWHPSYVDDVEIIYGPPLLRQVTALFRSIEPDVVLTQAPDDYMDDHIETARLAASAAFVRCMPNFESDPATSASERDITVYHALPHGLHDKLRRRVRPGYFVDTTEFQAGKRDALSAHVSQAEWLNATQGFGSYVQVMDDMGRAVGTESGAFEFAEGWRRHSSLGYSATDIDPLADALGTAGLINDRYEAGLR
jgi:LmbE family N-acetylglucosaminyl deacetylase